MSLKITIALIMRWAFTTIFVCVSSCFINPVSAQQHIFKNYTVNDGLINNSIRRIFQDSKGFLWIATWEGLSKYDGYKFTNYSTANGLSHNLVNDFYESKDGNMFVATNNGSVDVIGENKVIQKAVLSSTVINRFFTFPGGKVVATTDDKGIQEFRNGKLVKPAQAFPSTSFADLAILNDSLFIIIRDSGIYLFNKHYDVVALDSNLFAATQESKIYIDSQKRIWAGMQTGLMLLANLPQKNKPVNFTTLPSAFNISVLKHSGIKAIFEDADGIFWIGTTAGLVKINTDGTHQLYNRKNGLPSDIISCIFQDREKNIWIGTALGISKLVTRSNILIYTTDNGLFGNNMNFLQAIKKDHLLLSTEKGLQVFNILSGKFNGVANGIGQKFFSMVPGKQNFLLNNIGNIIQFDTTTLQFNKSSSLSFSERSIYTILSDRHGNYFSGNHYKIFFHTGTYTRTIINRRVACLLLDRKGFLWAGTWEHGLYRIQYNFEKDSLAITSNQQFLPNENIRSLFEDSRGNIWVGTRHHGLYRIRENKKGDHIISNFNQRSGLSSDFVKGIIEDRRGSLWIAYNQGLDKLIPIDTSYRIYNFSRINNYFAGNNNMAIGSDNSLWLSTAEGMAHITDGEMEKISPLPVYITKASSPDSIYPLHSSKLNLSYRHNQIQFEFSSPGFINEKQVLYSYRLLGSNTDNWTEPANEHSVSFASLRPGHYVFEVRSLGWNGVWGEPDRFEFTVAKPFWQAWWFLTCCILFISALIFWLVRQRISNIRHQAEMKHKLAETEMAALRAQMNPHFIFNCINSIDALIQSNDKYQATVYLNKFAKLIRNILESSKQNLVSLSKDLETLKLYVEMEQFRNENKFTCTIKADDAILRDDYKVPPLIIQPFVENAILHGLRYRPDNDGKLCVWVTKKEDYLQYIIEDNGVGRTAVNNLVQKEKLSYGIEMSNDRVKLFNNEEKASVQITDLFNNNNPAGTKVEVFLKIQ